MNYETKTSLAGITHYPSQVECKIIKCGTKDYDYPLRFRSKLRLSRPLHQEPFLKPV